MLSIRDGIYERTTATDELLAAATDVIYDLDRFCRIQGPGPDTRRDRLAIALRQFGIDVGNDFRSLDGMKIDFRCAAEIIKEHYSLDYDPDDLTVELEIRALNRLIKRDMLDEWTELLAARLKLI